MQFSKFVFAKHTRTHSSSTILVALVASIINQKLNIWGKASPYYVVGILQFNKYGFAMFVFLNELWAVCTQKSAKKSQCCTSFWRKRRTTHHPQIYTRHQQRSIVIYIWSTYLDCDSNRSTHFLCNTLVVWGAMQLTLQSVCPCLLQMAIENRPKLPRTTWMVPWRPGPSLSIQETVMFSPSHR